MGNTLQTRKMLFGFVVKQETIKKHYKKVPKSTVPLSDMVQTQVRNVPEDEKSHFHRVKIEEFYSHLKIFRENSLCCKLVNVLVSLNFCRSKFPQFSDCGH